MKTCTDIKNGGYPNGYYSFQPTSSAVPISQFCTTGVSSYFAPVNAFMPLNYFPFNFNANDALSSLTLTAHGTIAYVAGQQGQCVAFDGSTNYFDYPIVSQYVFQYAFTVVSPSKCSCDVTF